MERQDLGYDYVKLLEEKLKELEQKLAITTGALRRLAAGEYGDNQYRHAFEIAEDTLEKLGALT